MNPVDNIHEEPVTPPFRYLPPDRLAARHEHLRAEIASPSPNPRSFRPTLRTPRFRIAALATSAACAVVLSVVLVDKLTRGAEETASPSAAPHVIQAIAPVWAHTNVRTDRGVACARSLQALLRSCGGWFASSPPGALELEGVPTEVATRIRGGTRAERATMRSIVANTRPSAIAQIDLVSSQEVLTLRMHATHLSTWTLWQEWLIAGAFRDRVDDPRRITLALGGTQESAPIQLGRAAPGPARTVTSDVARRTFENAAAQVDVNLDKLIIQRPNGVAVAATMTVGDPPAFLAHQMPTFLAALGDLWRDYDGVYIGLTDTSGRTVWEAATSGRTSMGLVASDQTVASCSPLGEWKAIAPPCPAR